MEFLDELTIVAGLKLGSKDTNLQDKITQWQKLSGYSYDKVLRVVSGRYSDLDRITISNELRDEVEEDWIRKGHDKDVYEHHLDLELCASTTISIAETQRPELDDTQHGYLMRLDGELSNMLDVAAILDIERLWRQHETSKMPAFASAFSRMHSIKRS